MLATSAVGTILIGACIIIVGALAGFIGRAVMQTYAKRQIDKRHTESLREFFFDTEKNEDTGVPAKKGWTTKVDERLTSQDVMLREIKADVKRFGSQIITSVDSAAKAAATEVVEQIDERARVNKRDQDAGR